MDALGALAAIAAAILGLILVAVKDRRARAPEEKIDGQMSEFDEALLSGDTDRLSAMFDELRIPANPDQAADGSDSRGPDDTKTGQRKL